MWGALLFLALGAASPEVQAAHAELDAVATRIEQLKAQHATGADVGRELHRLLVRAQELSHVIERASAGSPHPLVLAPSPDELRERADAARDEADRIVLAIAGVDQRIGELRRAEPGRARSAGAPEATFASVRPGGAISRAQPGPPSDRLRALLAHRALLAERLAAVAAEVERLEAEAAVIEGAP